ncbi:putative signal peptide-containing secreted protein [Cryptosporidium canis]|uniref:Signal peptide-containing secreted protein n=1 Tax=Cryptosporidium canis TaxID=195482 RepID=A0ABQ8P2Z6_9CRYT|nr:putative signal peptide-containing secreted protein [Cryptosporidium canis]
MSGSDIRVCILRNVNIEINQLWLTIVPEILCELMYLLHRIKSSAGRSVCKLQSQSQPQPQPLKDPPKRLDPSIIIQSDPIIKLSPKYQLLSNTVLPSSQTPSAPPSSPNLASSSPFGKLEDNISRNKQKLIVNENLDRQLQISCKISQPSLIFCDNTQSSSGFEVIFHEFEAHFIIQYFLEYLQSGNFKLYSRDEDFYISGSESPEMNIIHHDSSLIVSKVGLSKKTRRSLKLVLASKLILGNSILHLDSEKSPLLHSKQAMLNTMRDGDLLFDRMFVIEHYKSMVEISDHNFVKLYFKSSIQRMFGVWRENGFYQNLTSFLQLIKFPKYLSKTQAQTCADQNRNNQDEYLEKPLIWQQTEELPKIPIRIELDDDDILKSDFLIKNNKYLKEIMTIKDFAVNLLFYLEIKEIAIQTNDIHCFNDELSPQSRREESNIQCEDCFQESFGPTDRYKWRTDLDSGSEAQELPFFLLKVANLKICNTSLNRSFSMLFSDMDLYSMDEFVDLEDISTKYLQTQLDPDKVIDWLDLQKVSIYQYGCFHQRTHTISFGTGQNPIEKNHLLKLNEALIMSPWDQKRTSLRCKGLRGDLGTCYVPLYLYILGCFSTDCLSIKRSNLSKVYYGVNHQFDENFDFYCQTRSKYYEKFELVREEIGRLVANLDDTQPGAGAAVAANVGLWTVPDVILSKEGSPKYTWYFDFDDISIRFLDHFSLTTDRLSLYRCNEHGNYDIRMSQVRIFDPLGVNILSSSLVRMRSDIPFRTTKIKSPICLKKQLRRILDLSENGDLLLLSILGNRQDTEANLRDITNGMICFDSKRFILEIDQLDLLLLVNCEYLESLVKYIYQYIYITFYQLFHPPLIIRTGKLLSFSRQSPIVFSCNNMFEFVIAKTSLNMSRLADFMLDASQGAVSRGPPRPGGGMPSKDDFGVQYSLKSEQLPSRRPKVGQSNILSLPILETKLDYLRMSVRTKHTSNSRSACNDQECYRIPNCLTNSRSSEEGFLINPAYNPMDMFLSLVGVSLNLFSQLRLSGGGPAILSRREASLSNEMVAIDFRRKYDWLGRSPPELSSDVKVSILSKSKTSVQVSSLGSLQAVQQLNPVLALFKRLRDFKSKFKDAGQRSRGPAPNEYRNVRITRQALVLSLKSSDRLSLSLAPYGTRSHSQREMSENPSLFANCPSMEVYLEKADGCHKTELKTASLRLKEGVVVGLVSKEIFAPVSRKKSRGSPTSAGQSQSKYSLKSAIVSLSTLNMDIRRSSEKGLEIDLKVDGLDKESIADRYLGPDPSRPEGAKDVPLTVNLDLEKFTQLSTILRSFLDEGAGGGGTLDYCTTCRQLRPSRAGSFSGAQADSGRDRGRGRRDASEGRSAQLGQNLSLEVSLNYMNLRYEIFSVLIKQVWLSLDRQNSAVERLSLEVNEAQLIAECFPYRLSQLAKSSQSLQLLRGSNVQISSNLSGRTKMLEIARIRKVLFEMGRSDSVLVFLGTPQLSLSTLNLVYLDTMLKLLNILKSSSGVSGGPKQEKDSQGPERTVPSIPLLNKRKLNIQVDGIMVNVYSLGAGRDFAINRDDCKIRLGASYPGAEKTLRMPDLDCQNDFLSQVIEQNPLNCTFTLVDELEECNADPCIFQAKDPQSCLECRYSLNRPLIYSSKILADKKGEGGFGSNAAASQLEFALRKYCNDYLQSLDDHHIPSLETIQEYRRICQYTENTVSIPLEYGQIVDDLVLGEIGCRKWADHIYLSKSFGQIICRIPRIDCSVGIYDSNGRFEFMIKMFPVSIDHLVSNRLIWNLLEGSSGRSSGLSLEGPPGRGADDSRGRVPDPRGVSRPRPEDPSFWDGQDLGVPESGKSRSNPSTLETPQSGEHLESLPRSLPKRSEEEALWEGRGLAGPSLEILRTTPVFVSVRILTGKPSTQLKMYSSLVSLSIDSHRVQSINEILHSFELRNASTARTQQPPCSTSQSTCNQPSFISGSNTVQMHSHSLNASSANVNSVMGGSLPPPIYYSNSLNMPVGQAGSGEQSQNVGGYQLSGVQGHNHSTFVSTKTPSVLSFSSYLYEQRHSQGQRVDAWGILNQSSRARSSASTNSLDLNPKRMLLNGDLSDKNVSNMLKFEIDKYLADNPLFYTVVDNVQCQVGGDSGPISQYRLQIEFILDQLNVEMFMVGRSFSRFWSRDINFVMFSNSSTSDSTIIEFDTSFIHLSANKDFFHSNSHSSVSMAAPNAIPGSAISSSGHPGIGQSIPSCNLSAGTHSSLSPNNSGWSLHQGVSSSANPASLSATENCHSVASQDDVSVIQPMYIDGHTSEGHGHVLSIRINMRQPTLGHLQAGNSGGSQSQSAMLRADSESVLSTVHDDIAPPGESVQTSSDSVHNHLLITGSDQEHVNSAWSQQQPNGAAAPQSCSSKNILYFNYLRISAPGAQLLHPEKKAQNRQGDGGQVHFISQASGCQTRHLVHIQAAQALSANKALQIPQAQQQQL